MNDDPIHYQALGMKSINGYPNPAAAGYEPPAPDEQKHLEMRAVYNQVSARHFTLMAALQEARINFLAQQKGAIVFIDKPNRPYTDTELYSRFYAYVTEMGLNFEDYRPLFSTYHLWSVDLDPFLLGHVQWSNPEHVEAMQNWALDAPISAFIRKKFVEAFSVSADASNEDLQRVKAALGGVINHAGERTSANAGAVKQIMAELQIEISNASPTIVKEAGETRKKISPSLAC